MDNCELVQAQPPQRKAALGYEAIEIRLERARHPREYVYTMVSNSPGGEITQYRARGHQGVEDKGSFYPANPKWRQKTVTSVLPSVLSEGWQNVG